MTPLALADVLPDTIQALTSGPVRWPRLRTGERDPIAPIVRRLVYQRDNRQCIYCRSTRHLQLDHVVPWSAGGSDRSDNLRTLCGDCNADRSNFREGWQPRLLPVVAYCDPCWSGDDLTARLAHQPAYCGWCRSVSFVTDPGRLL